MVVDELQKVVDEEAYAVLENILRLLEELQVILSVKDAFVVTMARLQPADHGDYIMWLIVREITWDLLFKLEL